MKATVPRNDFEQLDPDPQIGIRFNTGADMLLATSQTRRHEQMALAADASPHQTQAQPLTTSLPGPSSMSESSVHHSLRVFAFGQLRRSSAWSLRSWRPARSAHPGDDPGAAGDNSDICRHRFGQVQHPGPADSTHAVPHANRSGTADSHLVHQCLLRPPVRLITMGLGILAVPLRRGTGAPIGTYLPLGHGCLGPTYPCRRGRYD